MTDTPKPRPRPGHVAPEIAETIGATDTGSKAKAKAAHDRTKEQQAAPATVPVNENGTPLVLVSFTASELIPTGNYANVSVGPATASIYIDPEADEPIDEQTRSNVVNALNQLAEAIEIEVLGVQRNLILQALQNSVSGS